MVRPKPDCLQLHSCLCLLLCLRKPSARRWSLPETGQLVVLALLLTSQAKAARKTHRDQRHLQAPRVTPVQCLSSCTSQHCMSLVHKHYWSQKEFSAVAFLCCAFYPNPLTCLEICFSRAKFCSPTYTHGVARIITAAPCSGLPVFSCAALFHAMLSMKPQGSRAHSTLCTSTHLSQTPLISACFPPQPRCDPLPALQALHLPSDASLSHFPPRRKASCQHCTLAVTEIAEGKASACSLNSSLPISCPHLLPPLLSSAVSRRPQLYVLRTKCISMN